LDEIRKFSSKVNVDCQKRYSEYLEIQGELEVIAKKVFWKELITMDINWRDECKDSLNSRRKPSL